MNKLITVIAAIVLVFLVGRMSAQPPQKRFSVKDDYLAQWDKHLSQIRPKDKLAATKVKLSDITTSIGFIRLGGTGNQLWIFRIDDFYEVVVAVDHDENVLDVPKIGTARKWLRYPDGSVVESTTVPTIIQP